MAFNTKNPLIVTPNLTFTSLLFFTSSLSSAAIMTDDIRQSGYLGASFTDFDYQEFDHRTRLNQEQGQIPGFTLGWRVSMPRIIGSANFSYSEGDVDYDGLTQRGNNFETNTRETITRGNIEVGWRLNPFQRLEYQALLRVGYRNWRRDIRSTSPVNGLLETYRWAYAGLGAKSIYRYKSGSTFALSVMLQRPINPEVEIEFVNGLDDAKVDLSIEESVDVQVSWEYQLTDSLSVETALTYIAWDYDRNDSSDVTQRGVIVGSLYEPVSESREYVLGLRICKVF